jgi:phosphoglycolate phosphatase-like HAD superfamily hydrolase
MNNKDKTQNRLVIFDLVSTLTDAGPRYAKAFTDVCNEFGFRPPSEDEILKDLGNKNLKQIIEDHIGELPEDRQKEFMDKCNTCCDTMLYNVHWHERLFPGVRKTLRSLSENGFVLGVYTGTRDDALDDQLRYHNVYEYFDPRLIRAKNNDRDGFIDSNTLKKQQLRSIVSQVEKELPHLKHQILVVGDSVADYEAAKATGLDFIGFAQDEKSRQRLNSAGVKKIFSHFSELEPLVSKSGAQNRPKFRPPSI